MKGILFIILLTTIALVITGCANLNVKGPQLSNTPYSAIEAPLNAQSGGPTNSIYPPGNETNQTASPGFHFVNINEEDTGQNGNQICLSKGFDSCVEVPYYVTVRYFTSNNGQCTGSMQDFDQSLFQYDCEMYIGSPQHSHNCYKITNGAEPRLGDISIELDTQLVLCYKQL